LVMVVVGYGDGVVVGVGGVVLCCVVLLVVLQPLKKKG
jgi:hypothetical protein